MLLAIDIGNTQLVFGIFEQGQLRVQWRLNTDRNKTADEYGALCLQLLQFHRIDPAKIKAAIIASVVPSVQPALAAAIHTFFNLIPLNVSPALKTGLTLQYDQPEKLGADRLVNAAAAYALYGGPVLIIDLGTATKFCVVAQNGDYQGGIIAPGIKTSAAALTQTADQLPGFELKLPPRVIGTNTIHCMQSGILYGQIALLKGLSQQIKAELELPAIRTVATGGLASLVAPSIPEIDTLNPNLTLEGLNILYRLNRE